MKVLNLNLQLYKLAYFVKIFHNFTYSYINKINLKSFTYILLIRNFALIWKLNKIFILIQLSPIEIIIRSRTLKC